MKNYLPENMGRLISWSKSSYTKSYPTHIVIFNANICTINEKIWYGDLDITKDIDMLKNIAETINQEIYVLYESDARFKYENNPNINNFVIKIYPNGNYNINDKYKKYFNQETLLINQ